MDFISIFSLLNQSIGIFEAFRQVCPLPYTKRIFDVIPSSIHSESFEQMFSKIWDFNDGSRFSSKNLPNQSIIFDFIHFKHKPSKYYLNIATEYWMKKWKLEASNDFKIWDILDEATNNEQNYTKELNCDKYYRFFRITMNGQTDQVEIDSYIMRLNYVAMKIIT